MDNEALGEVPRLVAESVARGERRRGKLELGPTRTTARPSAGYPVGRRLKHSTEHAEPRSEQLKKPGSDTPGPPSGEQRNPLVINQVR